jgi:hypothetical protein
MMTHPSLGLDDHEIEPQWESRNGGTIRKSPTIEEAKRRRPHPRPFAVIDGLLGQAVSAAGAPTHLDDDQRGRRTRVDRHEIEFVATDMDVPGQDGPTQVPETRSDECLGGIAGPLCCRSRRIAGSVRHPGIVAVGAYPPRIGRPSRSRARLRRAP